MGEHVSGGCRSLNYVILLIYIKCDATDRGFKYCTLVIEKIMINICYEPHRQGFLYCYTCAWWPHSINVHSIIKAYIIDD